jgi:hypothetical protein
MKNMEYNYFVKKLIEEEGVIHPILLFFGESVTTEPSPNAKTKDTLNILRYASLSKE